MAENLNYAGANDDVGECYEDNSSNCDTYGRLYTWSEATESGFCPSGWVLPENSDWTELVNFVDNDADVLKNGAFAALLGGYKGSSFTGQGTAGRFWSKNQEDDDDAHYLAISSENVSLAFIGKERMLSVRCLKN